MWVLQATFVLFVVSIEHTAEGKPFLRNTVQSISSSLISASADTSSNISDLRRSGKLQKSSKYLEDQEDDFFKDTEVDDVSNTSDQNEAVPGIFQKKIAKILRKIQLISQLSKRINPNNNDSGNDDKDFNFDFDDSEEFEGSDNSTVPNVIEIRRSETEEIENDGGVGSGSKLDFSPSGIGVYFMELVGSIFGLVYGAAIQVVNSTNAGPSD